MTWEGLLILLNHMNAYPDGQKLLKQPIIVANETVTKFLGIGGFQILNDLGKLCVLTTNKQDGKDA